MTQNFYNLEDLADWMLQNGDRKQRYYYAFNANTNVWTVSDKRIRATKNTIVRHPNEIAKCYRAKWLKYIGDAFGGLVCKSTVIEYFGRETADVIPFDAELDNPYYKCSPPMKLYIVDKLIPLAKVKKMDSLGRDKLAKVIQSKDVDKEKSNIMRLSA